MSENSDSITTKNHYNIFVGDGEMATLMRNYDWEQHPMGAPESWPNSLISLIRLMLHSDFPMFIWWSPDLYMFHNDAYLPALGKKHPQALGAKAKEMWPEIWSQLGVIAEEILNGGRSFFAQELLIMLDRKGFGEETYWTFSYSPAPDDKGGTGGVFCACTEVTKSVIGQRRLKTVKNISDFTVKVNTVQEAGHLVAGAITENKEDIPFSLIYLVNNEGSNAFLIGKSGELSPELIPDEVNLQQPEGRDIWSLAEVFKTKKEKNFYRSDDQAGTLAEKEFLSGKKVVVHPVLKPGEDKVIGFFITGISPKLEYDSDYRNFHELLSGQIAASLASVLGREEANRQQEDLIQLFQQAPVAIAILRGDKFVVDLANSNMCEFWGRLHEQVINRPVFDALPEAKGQGLEKLLQEVITKGVTHSHSEYLLELNRRGKREKLFANFIYYPFRNALGVITGVIAIAVEVTEQVEARKEIEAKNKELMAINADLDNFVYSASHDLKGPILNIEGLMRVLLPKLPDEARKSKKIEEVVDMVFGSINRLKLTIDDLSEVSRVQKEAEEDVRDIDINDVVEEVLSDMQLTVMETRAIIEVTGNRCSIPFSPRNMKSIVYNLISNAIKYRDPERRPHIRINCEKRNNELIFSVSDNGLGMDLKYENKIFSMFKRLHSHVEGTGIGLYIVKKIVENAGGRIEVASKVNEGSVFTIRLGL